MRSRWNSPLCTRALAACVVLTVSASGAGAQSVTDSLDSYWGPFPQAADSVRAVFRNHPRPAWETAVLVPYWIIGFPLRLVATGVGEGIQYLDQSGAAATVAGWLGPRTGPFGVIVSVRAGGLGGTGAGLIVEHGEMFGRPGTAFRARAAATIPGDLRASGALRVPVSSHVRVDAGGGYRFRNRVRYFGIGPERDESAESLYRQRTWWAGTELHAELGPRVTATAGAVFSSVKPLDAELGDDEDDPPITIRYADSLPTGFGETSNGIGLAGELMHRDVTDTGRPERGGVRRGLVGYFRGTGSGPSTAFWHVRGELQQFIPLWYRYHVLALRAVGAWIQPVGDTDVPFTRLLTNDDPDLLRGYDDLRWRDQGLAIISAEYRWPLWAYERAENTGLDLYLLADVGQVFGALDEIRGANLTFSYGAGLRLVTVAGFVLRIEHARSDDDAVWRLRGDQVFQNFSSALYHGREPNPAR